MEENKEIINRVEASGLVTLDLESFYEPGERILIDIKDQLELGLVLREKNFRNFIKSNDWRIYANKFVAVTCSADAIIPTWAYMLLTIALRPHARMIFHGTLEQLEERLLMESISKINWPEFRGKKVVVKGCSRISVPVSVYVEVTRQLQPVVSSLMFGEPCSTVPLYKAGPAAKPG